MFWGKVGMFDGGASRVWITWWKKKKISRHFYRCWRDVNKNANSLPGASFLIFSNSDAEVKMIKKYLGGFDRIPLPIAPSYL